MKIKSVLFENFIALDTGLSKRKVFIDFSKFKNQIILLVGPMGSGKTTILSHLIPYSQVGTFDERNSDPIIIPGENGKEEIVYDDNGTIYKITHKYTWTKDHHATKSYIEKNGEELNPNGNQSSFKDIVETELGFNSDLIRLLRLGPNVVNVIGLSTMERKNYIARLQNSTEVYLTIYKDMKEKSRALTSQAQLIAKKLNGVTEDDIIKMKDKCKSIDDSRFKKNTLLEKLKASLNSLETKTSVYLNGGTIEDFVSKMSFLRTNISTLETSIRNSTYDLESVQKEHGSIDVIMKSLGKCEADIDNNNQLIMALSRDTERLDRKRVELSSTLKTVTDDEYVKSLQKELERYKSSVSDLRESIDGFECKYNSSEIGIILGQIRAMDVELNGLVTENPYAIQAVVKGGYDVVQSSKSQIEKMQGRIIKLRKSLDNAKYIANYDVSDELALPKCCKTFEICPFYYTHPNVVKKSGTDGQLEFFRKINDEIDQINARMDELLSYPSIYNRIEHCKKIFNDIAPKVKTLGALRVNSVSKILTKITERVWYDYDTIMDAYEKCVQRETLAVNEAKLSEIELSLNSYLNLDSAKLKEDYEDLVSQIASNRSAMTDIEKANQTIRDEQTRLEEAKKRLRDIDNIKQKIKEMTDDLRHSKIELSDMDEKYSIISKSSEAIKEYRAQISLIEDELGFLNQDYMTTTIRLNSILEYEKEYASIASDLKLLTSIINASSPSKGIPLYHVEMFLNECVDDINDMIADILPNIEICEFNINDKEFKIPYLKNGRVIEDISSASQGEKSIISIALSFALMMKSSSKYNIPLLDEVDGPIHDVNRRSLLMIFSRYFKKIQAEQAFFITHNDIFEGYPIDIIATSADEHLDNKHGDVVYLS